MTTLTYHWKHLPTGVEGTRTIEVNLPPRGRLPTAWATVELLEKLAHWNADPRWKYWV